MNIISVQKEFVKWRMNRFMKWFDTRNSNSYLHKVIKFKSYKILRRRATKKNDDNTKDVQNFLNLTFLNSLKLDIRLFFKENKMFQQFVKI